MTKSKEEMLEDFDKACSYVRKAIESDTTTEFNTSVDKEDLVERCEDVGEFVRYKPKDGWLRVTFNIYSLKEDTHD